MRSNKLTYLPDEIGRIPRLRVLTLSDNEIKVLPYSLMNLKELQALWLAENQVRDLHCHVTAIAGSRLYPYRLKRYLP